MTTLLTFQELASHLAAWCGIRLTKKRLLKWRAEGLPVIDLGHRTKRYAPEAVEAWILSHSQSVNIAALASNRSFRHPQSKTKTTAQGARSRR